LETNECTVNTKIPTKMISTKGNNLMKQREVISITTDDKPNVTDEVTLVTCCFLALMSLPVVSAFEELVYLFFGMDFELIFVPRKMSSPVSWSSVKTL